MSDVAAPKSEVPEELEIRDDVAAAVSEESGDDVDDSSEDDDDDEEDEDAIRKVREGFIVDDEDEEPEKRRRKHKRRRKEREGAALDALDEDDLDLLMENSGARRGEGRLKRLKPAQDGDDESGEKAVDREASEGPRGLADIFADEEIEREEDDVGAVGDDRNILDEFEDFIEDDEFSDEDEARKQRQKAEQKQRQRKKGPRLDTSKLSSVDRESLQQLFEVFGNGEEYDWALDAQEMEDEGAGDGADAALDDVFEHAELKERMLTEEDNIIRIVDIPERYQAYRSNLSYAEFDDEELEREKKWGAQILYDEKKDTFSEFLEIPFRTAVGHVVEFISRDSYEVPFIWTHRRDFLLHAEESPDETGVNVVHKLLFEDDLWRIVHLDIEYHSHYEKRYNLEQLITQLDVDDDLLKDYRQLDNISAVQDLHDYVNFVYSDKIREIQQKHQDLQAQLQQQNEDGDQEEAVEQVPTKNKKIAKMSAFERIKNNVIYDGVAAYGISAKHFGENVQDQSSKGFMVPYRIHATDDRLESPEDLLEKLCEDDEVLYKDAQSAQTAIRKTFSEEIFHDPRIRAEVRSTFKNFASIRVVLTDKGRASIDNHSPFADIKYATGLTAEDLTRNPDLYLRMLLAEKQALVVVRVEIREYDRWFQSIFNCLKSDGLSEISEAWNREREIVLKLAFKKLTTMVALGTKEELRRLCERLVAGEVRRRFLVKVDQAPFTPVGVDEGTKPRVFALSFGKGDYDSAVVGAFVQDNGRITELFKLENSPLRDRENDEKFAGQLKEFFDHNLRSSKPDVIAICGYNAISKRLYDSVRQFVETNQIAADVPEDSSESQQLIPVIWGQDETARLYQNSERAKAELSDKPTLVKYCVGVARYVQNPLLEYVSLGEDIISLSLYEHQHLIPRDAVLEAVESVFVDIVNLVGVEINEVTSDSLQAVLLNYVAGLGPRKASGLIKNINLKLGGTITARSDLIEHELTSANIFINCSSFLNIPHDDGVLVRDNNIELLDATRIHPEDYDLARKMAADALDLDEEDMAHVEEQGGIIYQLMQEGVNKVDDLNLTAYGKELETKFGKKKYATLQSIKEELVNNYEELRRSFHVLDAVELFQMLTGETTSTFCRGAIVPVTINRVGKNYGNRGEAHIRYLKVSTSSLIQGNIEESHVPPKADYEQGQVVQLVVLDVFHDTFTATFSLLEEDIKRADAPKFVKDPLKWDMAAEEEDKQREEAKERAKLAKTKNVQHPLFFNFTFKQAEEYLAPQAVGDCVLRPSSRGPDYLTVTWKVANNLFQHLSIQEVNHAGTKEYIVEHKRYADLDQLIFQHVQAIAKHVDAMCRHPKFREGTLSEVNEWLESYTRANPKNSAYVFCYDHKSPGWFLLLFKLNVNTPVTTWHVKTESDGYRLKGFSYPNMLRLCNGFKQTFKSLSKGYQAPSQPAGGYGSYGY